MPPSTSRFAKLQRGPAEKLFAFDKYPTNKTLAGVEELLPAKAFPIELGQGELYIQWCGGGSGLGDPLLREPMRVYEDVIAGYVSTPRAEKAHGVILGGAGNLDVEATEHCRTMIRRERLGREPKSISNTNSGAKGMDSFSSSLEKIASGGSESVRCRHCETLICEGDTDWRSFVVQRESDLAEHLGDLGIWVQARDPEPLTFVERICPGCGIEFENAVMRPASIR